MSAEKKTVLVVDDSPVIQRLVEWILCADGFEVSVANDGQQALDSVRGVAPDVILLDVDMPGLDGFDTCRKLKEEPVTMSIPIIFMTAHATIEDKVRGFDLGAIDYVGKPFSPLELRARVRSAYKTKYLMDLLEQKARIDGLTGLYNRAYFDDRVEQELERAKRYGCDLAIVLLDIDRFKDFNDIHGHLFGDTVLCELAARLRVHTRSVDIVARYGGEEFVLMLPEQEIGGGKIVADRIRVEIEAARFQQRGNSVHVTASFGVASTQQVGYASSADLISAADRALYAAKQDGRNCVRLWAGTEATDHWDAPPNPARAPISTAEDQSKVV